MAVKNLVFLSYGNDTEYRRAIFSILSFWAWCAEDASASRILIYTDQPSFFEPYLQGLPVIYALLTEELLGEMLGNTGFIHRRKVSTVAMTFAAYPGEDVLFIDTDTFFITGAPELLTVFTPGHSYMHLREYTLDESLALFTSYQQPEYPQAFLDFIKGREFMVGNKPEVFTGKDYSWNSGVLGLTPDFAAYMPDVFKLTDEFYAHTKWFICEQMAFSLILQKRTTIHAAERFIFHYWAKRDKIFVDKLLLQLMEQYAAKDLLNRGLLRKITRDWHKKLKIRFLVNEVTLARNNRSWYYGFKKLIQLGAAVLQ